MRRFCLCLSSDFCKLSTGYPQAAGGTVGAWAIFGLWTSLCVAICACGLSAWAVKRTFAMDAALRFRLSEMEKSTLLTPSKLSALAEYNESLQRCEELLLKVNRREIARAKKRSDDGTFTDQPALTLKDQLRKRAGLVAGQPAPHREMQ